MPAMPAGGIATARSKEGTVRSFARRVGTGSAPPSLRWELDLWHADVRVVAGLDEVGRGPLAGPLAAAAVILPPSIVAAPWLAQVCDSKVLTPRQREMLDQLIRRQAVAVGIGLVTAAELDRIGVVAATHRAMRDAIAQLPSRPEHLLIDAFRLPDQTAPQTPIVHGDAVCVSIACASIVAKVARDRLMIEMDTRYPGYGFRQNKGYGTPAHLAALDQLGPCAIHRRSFAPLRLAPRAIH